MMKSVRYSAAAVLATGALTMGATAPATAAGPVITGGLVNITIVDLIDGDVLSNNNVALGVALGIAANVCDVNVNVLAVQLRDGDTTCTSTASGQRVDISQVQ